MSDSKARKSKAKALAEPLRTEYLLGATPLSEQRLSAMATQPSTDWRGLFQSAASSPLALVWTVFVLTCVIWQPVRLGFYHDDWPTIVQAASAGRFSLNMLRWIAAAVDATRPGNIPFRFLLTSLLGADPVAWQAALVAGNILISVLLMRIAQVLGNALGRASNLCAYSVGMCWLLLPWDAASSFWPTMLLVVVLLAIFASCLLLLVRGWEGSSKATAAACAVYGYLCCSYEAFYFQFCVFIGIGALLAIRKAIPWRPFLYSAAGLILAQSLAFLCYFHFAAIGNQRPIESRVAAILWGNLLTIPFVIRTTLGEVAPIFGLALAGSLVLVMIGLFRPPATKEMWWRLSPLAIAVAGAVISIFTFALGGRGIDAKGVGTRTLVLCSFWGIPAVAMLVSGVDVRIRRSFRIALLSLGAVMGTTLGLAHVQRATEWAASWAMQQKTLAEAPIQPIRATEPDAVILLVHHPWIEGVPVFSASWDINYAMPLTLGQSVKRHYVVYNPWSGPLDWNGTELKYGNLEMISKDHPVYVWKPAEAMFHKATTPFRVTPDLVLTSPSI